MISDAVNGNWSIARDTVKDTVSIALAHAEGALMPAVEPIIEQTKARESYSRRCNNTASHWMRFLGLPPHLLFAMRICSPPYHRRASTQQMRSCRSTARLLMRSMGVRDVIFSSPVRFSPPPTLLA